MKALLEEAIKILEEEKNILWVWVDQVDSHGLSTAQVSSMMDRIEYLQKKISYFKSSSLQVLKEE